MFTSFSPCIWILSFDKIEKMIAASGKGNRPHPKVTCAICLLSLPSGRYESHEYTYRIVNSLKHSKHPNQLFEIFGLIE